MKTVIANNPFDNHPEATHYYVRSYTRAELARQYFPHNEESAARKKFNACLRSNPNLMRELADLGVSKKTRLYLPRQVQVIYTHLGLPEALLPYW